MSMDNIEVAQNRTEAVMLKGRYGLKEFSFLSGNCQTSTLNTLPKGDVKQEHVHKSTKIRKQLKTCLWQIRSGKRKSLASVFYCIILYAAPVWEEVIKLKKYRVYIIILTN